MIFLAFIICPAILFGIICLAWRPYIKKEIKDNNYETIILATVISVMFGTVISILVISLGSQFSPKNNNFINSQKYEINNYIKHSIDNEDVYIVEYFIDENSTTTEVYNFKNADNTYLEISKYETSKFYQILFPWEDKTVETKTFYINLTEE